MKTAKKNVKHGILNIEEGNMDKNKNEVILQNREEISNAIALSKINVEKLYLSNLEYFPIVAPEAALTDQSTEKCLRFVKLKKLTYKKGEDPLQKLATVYHSAMSLGCNLIIIIDACGNAEPVDIYIGMQNSDAEIGEGANQLSISFNALKSGLKSNFPGIKFDSVNSTTKLPQLINDIFGETARNISSVSCVAALRDTMKTENKSYIQGIEKFIDTMKGNAYTAVFIAQPVNEIQLNQIDSGYKQIYSSLSSFRKNIWSYNETESESVMNSISRGISKTVTEGTSNTQSHTTTTGVNLFANVGRNSSNAQTQGINESHSGLTKAGKILMGVGVAAKVGSLLLPELAPVSMGLTAASGLLGRNEKGINESITNSIGKSFGLGGGLSYSIANGTSTTDSNSVSKGTSTVNTHGKTKGKSRGVTLQIENVNKEIDELLKKIDKQIKRDVEAIDYGGYNTSAYFISSKHDVALLAANTYRSLLMGDSGAVESSAINSWNSQTPEAKKIVDNMKEYLKRGVHPVFAVNVSGDEYIPYTAGTLISGKELPMHLGLPLSSVYGLPVIKHAEFGRNIERQNTLSARTISIGKIYHMGVREDGNVDFDVDSLSAHTFVAGSTGTGKSNTIYQLLTKLDEQSICHLVIEPAKGEYKQVMGKNCLVFGTNSDYAELLQINPFSFPEGIHVLEHIDRLVEILGACWPMYAAMPAVLKDAIESAYRNRGWDLKQSISAFNEFPTFKDVLEVLPKLMDDSLYSADTKSDYAGALITRVNSLTNGLNGEILCSETEISNQDLFDRDVIVDLSRVSSTETRSLIMGILIMKLQEYRMSQGGINQSLKHVTVLEEAHNLLRKTSFEQSQESANLQGKSVEMLTNSIAEMRTYGEGFIIADQAPGLLDESVIRNANTKIILRLPSEEDRKLVGKSVGLNNDQIDEITKLPKGVGVVYQNDWNEAVLCQFDKFTKEEPYVFEKKEKGFNYSKLVNLLLHSPKNSDEEFENIEYIKREYHLLGLQPYTKDLLMKKLSGNEFDHEDTKCLFYNVFSGLQIVNIIVKYGANSYAIDKGMRYLKKVFKIDDDNDCRTIVGYILECVDITLSN